MKKQSKKIKISYRLLSAELWTSLMEKTSALALSFRQVILKRAQTWSEIQRFSMSYSL